MGSQKSVVRFGLTGGNCLHHEMVCGGLDSILIIFIIVKNILEESGYEGDRTTEGS